MQPQTIINTKRKHTRAIRECMCMRPHLFG